MRPSTIAKILTLFSGAVSVVARSLPAQRSEINIHAAGGHGFSNPLAILEDTGASVDDAVSKATTQATTADVDGMGFVKRASNYEGARCATDCGVEPTLPLPNQDDCQKVYQSLYNKAEQFTVEAFGTNDLKIGDCEAMFVNNKNYAVTYDYWDFGGTTQWLNGACTKE